MPLSRKAIVDQALKFKNPSRAPVWVLGHDITRSDVLTYDLSLSDPNDPKLSEWGFRRLRRLAGGWAVPKEPVLPDWRQVDAYHTPPLDFKRRFAKMDMARRVCGDRYRLARLGLSGYAVYSALRGHILCDEDYLRDTDRFLEFMMIIMDFETSMFEMIARMGFHGIEFTDNWRVSSNSRMTLSLWRCVLRDLYAKQIGLARDQGLDVWFTLAMEDVDFFHDLYELGVNVIRVEHPGQMEVAQFGRSLHGRVSFATRLDELYDPQKPEESAKDIQRVYECLGSLTGGFIATIGANADPDTVKGIYDVARTFKGL